MSGRARTALLALFVLGGTYFVARGPMRWIARTNVRYNDLSSPYLSARAWLRGQNPYRADVFWRFLEEAGEDVPADDRIDGYESRTPYPPTAFLVLAPLAAFPWPTARLLALAGTLAVAGVAIGAFARVPVERRRRGGWALFVALALALSPLHSGISGGNLVAAAAAFTSIGVCAALLGWDIRAGVALALAASLKPQIVIPVVAYYAVTTRWRVVAASAAAGSLLLTAAAARLQWAGVPWVFDYLHNNSLLLAESGESIVSGLAEHRQFIHLQYLGLMMFGDIHVANTLTLLVTGVLLATWSIVVRSGASTTGSELLDVSALIVIGLLPFYHRVYDAALLLVPLAWLCLDEGGSTVWPRRIGGALMLPFFVPGVTWLEMQVSAHRVPDAIAKSWSWNALVMTHQVWALLLMSATLLLAMVAARREVDAHRH